MDFRMLWITVGAIILGVIVLVLMLYGMHIENKDK